MNNIKFVSPGEIQKGDYLIPFEFSNKVKLGKEKVPNSYGLLYESGNFVQYEDVEVIKIVPWIQGIPFKVIDVALPLVMMHYATAPTKEKPLPSIMFFDTRMARFILTDKEYYDNYIKYLEFCELNHNYAGQIATDTNGKPIENFEIKAVIN